MEQANGVLGLGGEAEGARLVQGLGARQLDDLRPVGGADVEDVDAAVAEAEEEGLHVGDVEGARRPHDFLHATPAPVVLGRKHAL